MILWAIRPAYSPAKPSVANELTPINASPANQKGEPVESTVEARAQLFQDAMGFSGISGLEIKKLAAMATMQRFSKGQMVFEQDQPCDYFHLVASGW